MKKNLLYLFVFMGFMGSKDVLSVDTFDIDVRSDHIVGKLWRGSEIPQKDISELFNLINVENKEQDIKEQNMKQHINSIITAYQDLMKHTAKYREENKENIDNIDKFISNVRALENKFAPQTIESGLGLISAKYDG